MLEPLPIVMSVSGTISVNCGWLASRKVIDESKKTEGVTLAYRVQKESQDEPDVIVNMSGVSEQQIIKAKEAIKKIKGVTEVSHRSGSSLLY